MLGIVPFGNGGTSGRELGPCTEACGAYHPFVLSSGANTEWSGRRPSSAEWTGRTKSPSGTPVSGEGIVAGCCC